MISKLLSLFTRKKQPLKPEKLSAYGGNLKPPFVRPSWDEVVKACYDKQLNHLLPVAKVLYTQDKTIRVLILERMDQNYEVAFQRLYPYDDEELQYNLSDLPGYWSPGGYGMVSIFDSVERAEKAILAEPPFKYDRFESMFHME